MKQFISLDTTLYLSKLYFYNVTVEIMRNKKGSSLINLRKLVFFI